MGVRSFFFEEHVLSATNASKCYGSYGCFELSPPWTSENRPVSLFPEELQKVNKCYLIISVPLHYFHLVVTADYKKFIF